MLILLFLLIILLCITFKKLGGKDIIKYEPYYDRKLSKITATYFEGRPHEEMMILKLGQRKLFFNELEFYTSLSSSFLKSKKEKAKKGVTVVYAGAASGIHSTLIAELFPEWQFHYYDTNAFSEDLKKYKNIHIYNQYFTEKEALSFLRSFSPSFSPNGEKKKDEKEKEGKLIFLSDIRSGTFEDAVDRDMAMQRKWVEIMKPDACMLKFRLPWRPGKTTYFKGDIYTQPRIGPTSTEMRLIFNYTPEQWAGDVFCEYDNEKYNDRCFNWQRHQRCAFYEIKDFKKLAAGIPGLCHCYDCWSEIEICSLFLASRERSDLKKDDEIIEFMKKVNEHTKSSLNIPPHNLLVNEQDINKKKKLLANITIKYIDSLHAD